MSRLRSLALAAAICAAVPASASAAGGFLPPRNLEPAIDSPYPHAGDFNAGGEALFATVGDAGGGKRAIFVDRRRAGGPRRRQVLPAGGSAQIGLYATVATDLSPSGRGVVAWAQGDAIHYALRAPGAPFGPAQTANLPPSTTAGIGYVNAGIDDAGNVTFAWTVDVGTDPNQTAILRAAQRRASDGAFASHQVIDQPGNGLDAVDPVLHVTASGRAALTYSVTSMGPSNGKVAFRDAAIATFAPSANEDSLNTPLTGAIDEAGDSAVVYQQNGTVFVRRRPRGGALGPPITIDTGGSESGTQIGIDRHATPTVVWVQNPSGTRRLVVCRVAAAGCAPGTLRILDTSPLPLTPDSLAEAPSGAAMLVWERDNGGGLKRAIAAAARVAGRAFRPPKLLAAGDSNNPLAGIDYAGDGIVSWRQDDAAGRRVRFSGFDPNPARIRALSVPKKGRVGKPIHFAAKALDVWGPVRFRWRFGDGAKARGRSVRHTYSKRGKRTVVLTVTDAAGNVSTAKRIVRVRPAS